MRIRSERARVNHGFRAERKCFEQSPTFVRRWLIKGDKQVDTEITIVFRFIFQDQVIAKRIPGEFGDQE
jgi:hypothetical protein